MVYTFEIIGLIFILGMVYFTRLEYKKKRISKTGFLFWTTLWIASAFLIIFHNYVNNFLPQLNIFRVLDLYMTLAFMFIFGTIFYLFVIIKHMDKRLEELARIIALKPLSQIKA